MLKFAGKFAGNGGEERVIAGRIVCRRSVQEKRVLGERDATQCGSGSAGDLLTKADICGH
jgi:hypothetical protein